MRIRRFIAAFLTLVMMFGILPASALENDYDFTAHRINCSPGEEYLNDMWIGDSLEFSCSSVYCWRKPTLEIIEGASHVELWREYGFMKLISAGKVTVDVTCSGGHTKRFEININEPGGNYEISSEPQESNFDNMWIGDSISFSASCYPHGNGEISCKVLEGNCIEYYGGGYLYMRAAGKAKVEVTAGDTVKTYDITVSEPGEILITSEPSAKYFDDIWVGDNIRFSKNSSFHSSSGLSYEILEGDSIENIGGNDFRAVREGTTKLKVKCGITERIYDITVKPVGECGITCSVPDENLKNIWVGDRFYLNEDEYRHNVSISSEILEGDCVEKVNGNSTYYKATKPGTATIKAVCGATEKIFTVNVTEPGKYTIASNPRSMYFDDMWIGDNIEFFDQSYHTSGEYSLEILEGDSVTVAYCDGQEAGLKMTSAGTSKVKVAYSGTEVIYDVVVREPQPCEIGTNLDISNVLTIGEDLQFYAKDGHHNREFDSLTLVNNNSVLRRTPAYENTFVTFGEGTEIIRAEYAGHVQEFAVTVKEQGNTIECSIPEADRSDVRVGEEADFYIYSDGFSKNFCRLEILEGNSGEIVESNEINYKLLFTKPGKLKVRAKGSVGLGANTVYTKEFEFTVTDKPLTEPQAEYLIPSSIKVGDVFDTFWNNDIVKISDTIYGSSPDIEVFPNTRNGYTSEHSRNHTYDSYEGRYSKIKAYDVMSCIPGEITIQTILNKYTGKKTVGEPYTVTIEEPVIKTDAPARASVGDSIVLSSELTNTGLDNVSVSELKRIYRAGCEHNHSDVPLYVLSSNANHDNCCTEFEHQFNFEPSIEILEGEDIVKRENGDYGNTLSSSEKLTFTGAGKVKLKIKYTMFNAMEWDDYYCFGAEPYTVEKTVSIDVAQPAASFGVTLPDRIYVNEDFDVSIITPSNYKNLKLRNEKGGVIGKKIISKKINPNGSVETVARLNVGTAGDNRAFGVYDGDVKLGEFTFNVFIRRPDVEVKIPDEIVAGERFSMDVTLADGYKKLVFKNESGNKIGTKEVSRKFNLDGSCTISISLSVGTAGNGRIFNIYTEEEKIGEFTFDVNPTVTTVYSVEMPDVIYRNEPFEMRIISNAKIYPLAVRNESGNKISCKTVSVSSQNDGKTETVIRLSVGTAGSAREISIFDGADMVGSVKFSVIEK